MKSLHAAVLVSVAVIGALWWAVMPPQFKPEQGGAIGSSRQLQCPEGSRLEGKLCTCPEGSSWTGTVCERERGAKKPAVVSEKLGPTKIAGNSLAFARTRVPSLPANLSTWPSKLDAINSAFPQAGSVAMIAMPAGEQPLGHVAVVEAVGEASLTIIEGNYVMGEVTRRTATASNLAEAARQLRIVGYFRP